MGSGLIHQNQSSVKCSQAQLCSASADLSSQELQVMNQRWFIPYVWLGLWLCNVQPTTQMWICPLRATGDCTVSKAFCWPLNHLLLRVQQSNSSPRQLAKATLGYSALCCESCLSELGAFIISIKAPVLALLGKNGSIINSLTLFFNFWLNKNPRNLTNRHQMSMYFNQMCSFCHQSVCRGDSSPTSELKNSHNKSAKMMAFSRICFLHFFPETNFLHKKQKNINKVQGGPLL